MKKTLSILTIALTVGLVGFQLANAGPGRGPDDCWRAGNCNGPQASAENSEQWQTFKNDTADLRQQLHEKRSEYQKLMNDGGDKDAAQALWSDMYDLRTQIREKAKVAGLPDRGFGRHGWGGRGCNGVRGGGYFADEPTANGADDMPCPGAGDCPNQQ